MLCQNGMTLWLHRYWMRTTLTPVTSSFDRRQSRRTVGMRQQPHRIPVD